MEMIKAVVEDTTLSPAEKVLFAILYFRKEGNDCSVSVQELVERVGVELETLRKSLNQLERGGFIQIKRDCDITDATSFLSCAVPGEKLKLKSPQAPRP